MEPGKTLRNKFGTVKAHLTSLDDQPLGKAVLVIILFLDLFILESIFNGLAAHTRQLPSPDISIPDTCREMVINQHWNPASRIDNLSRIVVATSTSQFRADERKHGLHPVCAPYMELLEKIRDDKRLINVFEERTRAGREAGQLQREIDALKAAYDTSLLETMAKGEENRTKTEATREEFRKKAGDLDRLRSRIAALEREIDGDASVRRLWDMLQGLREEERQRLLNDLRTANFWYPARKLAMQMAFLLPLFAAFYLWNNASIRKKRGLQTLVSSHLLAVSFIPILFKLAEAVYDIIPKKLLAQLMELLESLKLVAIWHYLVIALAVAAALVLIYLFQKKLFSPERMIERRISRGDCQNCGKQLPAGANACPFCGFVQFMPCGQCHGPTHVYGRYCRECGSPRSG